MIRSIPLILLISFLDIAIATETSPSRFDEFLTKAEKGFFTFVDNYTKVNTRLRQDIASLSCTSKLPSIPVPSYRAPQLEPSLESHKLQSTGIDHINLIIDRLQSRTSGIITSLQQENAALNQQLEQLKKQKRVKIPKVEEPSKSDDFFQALRSLEDRVLKTVSQLEEDNRTLKLQMPANIIFSERTPLQLPPFPSKESFLGSSFDYFNAVFDTVQKRIMGSLSQLVRENGDIKAHLATPKTRAVMAKSKVGVERQESSSLPAVVSAKSLATFHPSPSPTVSKTYLGTHNTSTTTTSSIEEKRKESPAPQSGVLVQSSTLFHPSPSTLVSQVIAYPVTPKLRRDGDSPKRNSSTRKSPNPLIKDDSIYGQFSLGLNPDVLLIVESQNLRGRIEDKVNEIESSRVGLSIVDNNKKRLQKQLNDATSSTDPVGTIKQILNSEIKTKEVHRPSRKDKHAIEATIDAKKGERIQKKDEEKMQGDINNVFTAIPERFSTKMDEKELNNKIAQIISGYQSGMITVVQTTSKNPLEPLMESLKYAPSIEKVNQILDSQLEQMEDNIRRKAEAEKAVVATLQTEYTGTYTFLSDVISLTDRPHHGENLSRIESDFFTHLKHAPDDQIIASQFTTLLQTSGTGLMASQQFHIDPSDPYEIKQRRLILKAKHLKYNPVSFSSKNIIIPEHYTYDYVYYKMQPRNDQYETLLTYVKPPYQLWYFHKDINGSFSSSCTFAISHDKVVSFNVEQPSLLPGLVTTHFLRARLLSKQGKVFESDLESLK